MAESYRKCLKCGLSLAMDPSVKLFRFPKPGVTNMLKCELWAKYCFPDKEWSSCDFQQQLYKEHKMLCNAHFKKTSFIDYPQSMMRLHKFAAPNDEIESKQILEPEVESEPMFEPEIVSEPQFEHEGETEPVFNSVMESTPELVPQPRSSNRAPCLRDKTNVPLTTHVPEQKQPLEATIKSPKLEHPPQVSHNLVTVDTEENQKIVNTERETYYADCKKLLEGICQLQNRINKLKNKKLLQEISKNGLVLALMEKLTPSIALLLQGETEIFSRKPKARTWTTTEKIMASRLFKKSPTCYRLMRKLFCLPAQSTIKTLLGQFELNYVGLDNHIFNVLSKYTKRQRKSDNEYVLIFDEMSFAKQLTHCRKKDGFQDHNDQAATHAHVFMVAGITKKVKEPVGYYPSKGSVAASKLAELIEEVLQKCLQSGLSIAATVCDLDEVNRRALDILGATVERPYIYVDNVEVITMFDPPHLLTCFRNSFMQYDIKCITQIKPYKTSGERIAKWSHIKQFHEVDNNPTFVFAPALTDKHLNPNMKQKMVVKLAAQVFSHTVAAGMMAKIASDQLSIDAATTVGVLENIDKLFDTLNSDSTDLRRGKVYAKNIKRSSLHMALIREMKTFFKCLQFIGSNQTQPSQEGWVWTLTAVERLWIKLTKKHGDIKNLATRRLHLEPLQKLFRCIRANCGSNINCQRTD